MQDSTLINGNGSTSGMISSGSEGFGSLDWTSSSSNGFAFSTRFYFWVMTRWWRVWKYALGSFDDTKTQRYDNLIVLVRSFIFLTYLITNLFIISGVIRHWNDL